MTEQTYLSAKDKQLIEADVSSVVGVARELKITNAVERENASETLKRIKAAQHNLEARKNSVLKPLKGVIKTLSEWFAVPEADLDTSEGMVKREILAWDDEQERLRKERQRELDAQAERERERLRAEALAKEKKAQEAADRAREQAEAARQAGDLHKAERIENRAAATESRLLTAAQEAQEAAQMVVAPIVPDAPRISGEQHRLLWSAEVHDKIALAKAVVEGKVPAMAITPNMVFLNNQAKAMRSELNYPGVKPRSQRILASGRK